ncbi:MAG: NAD(P)H-hydrate dehydratase [Flavobacterium sp.]
MVELSVNNIRNIFQKRQPDSHKGSHGHALIIAGSRSKMGAAVICAKACLRAGAGLVSVSIPKKERAAVFSAIPEAMIAFDGEGKDWKSYDSVAIGPGIGTDKKAEHLLKLMMENVNVPTVFDADALNILAKNQENLVRLPSKSILTPHPKEFDRLFGNHHSEEQRRQTAISKAAQLNLVIVLKGHKTFITDGTENYVNTTGNSGLAKGGSGDALTGIITAFLAQGYKPINAAKLGVFIHGLAADITLETQSAESMMITDVIVNLGKAFKKI